MLNKKKMKDGDIDKTNNTQNRANAIQIPLSAFKLSQQRYRRKPIQQKQQKKSKKKEKQKDVCEYECCSNDSGLLLDEIIDFSNLRNSYEYKHFSYMSENTDDNENNVVTIHPKLLDSSSRLSSSYEGKVYTLLEFPGFYFLPSALSKELQDELAYLSLTSYCESPHRTNIDLLGKKKKQSATQDTLHSSSSSNKVISIWESYKQEIDQTKKNHSNKTCLQKRMKSQARKPLYKKLSWSTMGYHYNWTERSYSEEEKSFVPPCLNKLCQTIFSSNNNNDNNNNENNKINPSAVIVNYYNQKSIMGGHADNLEYTFEKPVISLSVGLSAIFLLGGFEEDDESSPVVPIMVHSGDVIILGGKSRLRYHGMCRVLDSKDMKEYEEYNNKNVKIKKEVMLYEEEKESQLLSKKRRVDTCNNNISLEENNNVCISMSMKEDWPNKITSDSSIGFYQSLEKDKDYLQSYLSSHRININVRQVLPDDIETIPQYLSTLNSDD